MNRFLIRLACSLLALLLSAPIVRAQVVPTAPAVSSAQAEPPKDSLGRDTPRGTVLGFMKTARMGNDEIALQYLDTDLKGQRGAELAHKLYVVLDSRLPARLNEMSDRPEGALVNPLKPDQDVVGTISTANGPLDVVLDRVTRGKSRPVWLFSRKTLQSIPDVYDEIDLVTVDRYLPDVLARPRIAGIRLFEWLVLFLVIPFCYRLLGLLNLVLNPLIALWRRQRARDRVSGNHVPGFVRLLLLAVAIKWTLGILALPLFERQFWSAVAALLVIVAAVWILLLLSAYGERHVRRRFRGSAIGEAASLLRLVRRMADGLAIAAGCLVALRYLGVDATAALAGLGIGGIAVALAAQKTLENVIGGLSLVFDKAVQVGDVLKVGETLGTVDDVGLRSIRIRTLDRTILSVPNGQIANMGIETLSARDKFWFHHFIGLSYTTTPEQMRAVVEGVRKHLAGHSAVEDSSIRVRFFRLGSFSLDIEVFAYMFARDWERFLEIQEEALLHIMEIVEQAGTAIAFPSQTLYVADNPASEARADVSARLAPRKKSGSA
jgi:MscS family membrane protein